MASANRSQDVPKPNNAVRLDRKAAKALPGPEAGKFDVIHWDTELKGFGLRVLASGRRAWMVRYRANGKHRNVTLGTVAELDAVEARRLASAALGKKRAGFDEQAERQARKAQGADRSATFGGVAALYLEHRAAAKRPATRYARELHLTRDWAPLRDLPLEAVTRRQVAARLLEIAKDHGPVAANRSRASLNALFAWAIGHGLAEANPVAGTVPPGEERSRERTLSDAEVGALWRAAEGPGDYQAVVRLLLLTGQRREEVAGMRWGELDLERALWTLPGSRTKNGRAHEVPLAPAALAVLEGVPRRAGRDLLFGEGSGPFAGWSRSKRRLDGQLDGCSQRRAAGVRPFAEPWVLHDLRRTAVTKMAELGVAPHVVEAVVNHVSGSRAGVAGVYNRATYAKEKREALELWASRVLALAGGETAEVVPMRRRV